MEETQMTENQGDVEVEEDKTPLLPGEVRLSKDPRGEALFHKPRIRSSMLARFKERSPETVKFVNGLVESAVRAGGDIKITAAKSILERGIEGFPSEEVVNLCAFLAEITKDTRGFGHEWSEMKDEDKVDFFDLEISDLNKLSYLIAAYVKYLG
jgi:ribosomal protein L31E